MTTPEQREELRRLLAEATEPDVKGIDGLLYRNEWRKWKRNKIKLANAAAAALPALLDAADERDRFCDDVGLLLKERYTLKAQLTAAQERVGKLEKVLTHIAEWEIHTGATGSIPPPSVILDCTVLAAVCMARAALKEQP